MENKYNIHAHGAFPIQAEGHLPSGEWYYCIARYYMLEVRISPREKDYWCEDENSVRKYLDFDPDDTQRDDYLADIMFRDTEDDLHAMVYAISTNFKDGHPLIRQDEESHALYHSVTQEVRKYITDPKYKDWKYEGGNVGLWDKDLFVNICQNLIDEYYEQKDQSTQTN